MDAEQLKERIAELERQRNAIIQKQQEMVNMVVRADGAIVELKRWLAEMEQEGGEEA